MTESRSPGPSRHADPRSSDPAGANPLQRPLPPGLDRRLAGGARPAGPSHSAPTVTPQRPPTESPSGPENRTPAAPPSRPEGRTRAEARRERADAERLRSAQAEPPAPRRARANGSAIPLMAPPAWQVAGVQAEERQQEADRAVADQRGLPGWAGLVVLLVITGIGGLIDAVAGAGIKGTFSIGLVVGSLAAILLVRRSSMFPVVVAPPLVYFVASAVLLYVRSGGLSDRAAITDAAASWLVYGFPAIAGATALVLIVAGVRIILHR